MSKRRNAFRTGAIRKGTIGSTGLRAATLALLLASAAGSSQAQQRFVSFGDSLTDNGNLFALTGPLPTGPYASGRFSNGPVWIEYIAPGQTRFATLPPGSPTPAGPVNYAFGGSRTDTLATPGPGTATQVGAFLLGGGTFAPNDVATIWAGANDIFQGLPGAAATPATAQAVIGGIAATAANNVAAQTGQLAGAGARTIIVVNLPDFAALPQFNTSPVAPLAGFASNAFNTQLSTALAATAAANPNARILQVNVNSLFQALVANPAAFGFSNVTQSCLALPSCAGFAFFDGVHPTTAGHAIIAQVAQQYLNAQDRALSAASITEVGLSARRSAAYRAIERLQIYEPRSGKTDFYISALGDQASFAARGAAPGFSYATGGLEIGILREVAPNWAIGAAFSARTGGASANGFGNRFEYNPTAFSADIQARWSKGAFYALGNFGATFDRYGEIRRGVNIAGLENRADVSGHGFSLFVEAGYRHQVGAITITPSARFGYLYSQTDSFREQGVVAPLSYAGRTVSTFVGSGEIKAGTALSDRLFGYALIGYEGYFGQNSQAFRGAIAGSPGTGFSRAISDVESPGVTYGVGLTGLVSILPVTAEYRGTVDGSGRTQHRGTISTKLGF